MAFHVKVFLRGVASNTLRASRAWLDLEYKRMSLEARKLSGVTE